MINTIKPRKHNYNFSSDQINIPFPLCAQKSMSEQQKPPRPEQNVFQEAFTTIYIAPKTCSNNNHHRNETLPQASPQRLMRPPPSASTIVEAHSLTDGVHLWCLQNSRRSCTTFAHSGHSSAYKCEFGNKVPQIFLFRNRMEIRFLRSVGASSTEPVKIAGL